MNAIKYFIFAAATLLGLSLPTQGSIFSNVTYRTLGGKFIATLGTNPTISEIAQYVLNQCAPGQSICMLEYKDGQQRSLVKGTRIR
ncbi:hypothetical protein [Chitinophaga nivalis]|uniref:PDZ domain-containing protein n=1 Tax=Chitinophaga nivalis TaxID=2991709 RepID=A0ABT3IQF2_9BACT|nr:hypothetical protein [Chitinophaga nivalis]MCW3464113.1 hypothetical protein [Chitinophaga nivalis]MCW3486197.1 hypothetical protein [Chitinophaga nivalis]